MLNIEPESHSIAVCKAKKSAYNQAVQSAFHKVVLVVLGNGKVHVEVNTTVRDLLDYDQHLKMDDLLKVNDG